MKGRKNLRRVGIVLGLGALLCAGVMASGALGMALVDPGSTDSTSTAADHDAGFDGYGRDVDRYGRDSTDPSSTDTTPTSTDTTPTRPIRRRHRPIRRRVPLRRLDSAPATTVPPTYMPSISSDKVDYAPGGTVVLTGSGWASGESVRIFVNDDVGQSWSNTIDVVADVAGTFTTQFQLPDWFVAAYKVTATGAFGGTASTGFTDANANITSPAGRRIPTSATQSVAAGTSFDFAVTYVKNTPGGNDPELTTPFLITNKSTGSLAGQTCGGAGTTIPSGWLSSQAPNSLPQTITTTAKTINYRVSVPPGTSGGLYTATIVPTVNQGSADTFDLCISVPAIQTTSLSVSSASGSFGGTTSLSATLTSAGSGVNGKTISFTLNGTAAGSATTNSSGVATLSGASLTGINVGSYATGVGASFTGDSGLSSSNGTGSLTVNKAGQTITFTAPSGVRFGDADSDLGATASSGLPVSYVSSTPAVCTIVSGKLHVVAAW